MRGMADKSLEVNLECVNDYSYLYEPTPEQRENIEKITREVISKINEVIEELGLRGVIREVSVQGSFARDTWLPEDTDVDVFLLFDKSFDFEQMRKMTELISGKVAVKLGASIETRFASHPYYVIGFNRVEVEIVPAYKIEDIREMRTAVDRTPFHTSYITSSLLRKPWLKKEIRVLKVLLKRLGIYGAELEVRGFSGYLSEVLVIAYDGLVPLLEAASRWIPWKVLIPHDAPRSLIGTAPLIVLDPVDLRRNAAAAVGLEQLSKFIAFSKIFVENPEILCCMLEGKREVPDYMLDENIIILRLLSHPPLSEDALAGKLRRILDSTRNTLERNGFNVLRGLMVHARRDFFLVFQLETSVLPPLEKKIGPPVWHTNSKNFLRKWASHTPAPFIDGDRWVVISERKIRKAEEVIMNALKVYKGFEWEIMRGEESYWKIAEDEYREIKGVLAGSEIWIYCLKKYVSGHKL
jgi:tRNA nucleotidyltransferase (CCA-adding enzyme)